MGGLWALFSADADDEGKVETWDQDPVHGDDYLGDMTLVDAVDWTLNEIPEGAKNAVIVNERGTIGTWIMNSPAGEPRTWDVD